MISLPDLPAMRVIYSTSQGAAPPGTLLEESPEGLLVRAGQDGFLIQVYENAKVQ